MLELYMHSFSDFLRQFLQHLLEELGELGEIKLSVSVFVMLPEELHDALLGRPMGTASEYQR